MDLDEDAFREGRVTAMLYGYLRVPTKTVGQCLKSGSTESEPPPWTELLKDRGRNGPMWHISSAPALPPARSWKSWVWHTLLGVDVVLDKELSSQMPMSNNCSGFSTGSSLIGSGRPDCGHGDWGPGICVRPGNQQRARKSYARLGRTT